MRVTAGEKEPRRRTKAFAPLLSASRAGERETRVLLLRRRRKSDFLVARLFLSSSSFSSSFSRSRLCASERRHPKLLPDLFFLFASLSSSSFRVAQDWEKRRIRQKVLFFFLGGIRAPDFGEILARVAKQACHSSPPRPRNRGISPLFSPSLQLDPFPYLFHCDPVQAAVS